MKLLVLGLLKGANTTREFVVGMTILSVLSVVVVVAWFVKRYGKVTTSTAADHFAQPT